jgi:hypothetical protein
MHITDAQIETYKQQGFLIVENFLTKDEWSEPFTRAMTTRYPGFDPAPYDPAR